MHGTRSRTSAPEIPEIEVTAASSSTIPVAASVLAISTQKETTPPGSVSPAPTATGSRSKKRFAAPAQRTNGRASEARRSRTTGETPPARASR